MKFTVDADELRVATAHARSTVARGHSAPILGNILIETSENAVNFRSTDIQVELEITLDAKVVETGGLTVSANVLNDLARRFPTGLQVEFEWNAADDERLRIKAGSTDCLLPTLPKDDFPVIARTDYDISFPVDTRVLYRLFDLSKVSVAPDSPRKYLQGVCLHTVDGPDGTILRCVSSDGFHMSRIDAVAPPGSESMEPIIIPHKAVLEVIKMLEGRDNAVQISVSKNKVQFSGSNMTFSVRVVNAKFPDYSQLIPEPAGIRMEVDSATCLNALSRMSAVTSREGTAVQFNMADDHLAMTVNSPFSGTIKEELNVAFPHKEMKIKFKHDQLLGIFGLLKEGSVVVDFQADAGATRFSSRNDQNALFVVMPIRI